MTSSAAPVLRLRGVARTFGSAVALADVDLAFTAGTVTALTGENGSGKSTIAKIMGGVLAPSRGGIEIDGTPVRLANAKVALQHGVALISQELTLAPELTVAENIFMGRLPAWAGVGVSWRRVRRAAADILAAYQIPIDVREQVGELPIELQQQVEIARALAVEPRVLILDEATSSLSEKAADRLLTLVEERRRAGTAVVMITHRMGEIYRAASRAAVLRDGRIVTDLPIPETPVEQLIRAMVGRELGDYYGTAAPRSEQGGPVLTVRGASATGLASTDLEIRAGEILGVAGLSGSGKEVLGHVLSGSVAGQGELEVDGRTVRLSRPRSTLRHGVGFVPEDRKAKALLLERSVAENLSIAWSRDVFRRGIRRPRFEQQRVHQAVQRYDIRTASHTLPVQALSGGNQQKITIGRLFELGLPVYVMSEPTRGIDVGSKSAIYGMLREQAARGAGVLFISSELNELCGMCDRVLVMYAGRPVAELVGAQITEEAINHVMVTGTPWQPAA